MSNGSLFIFVSKIKLRLTKPVSVVSKLRVIKLNIFHPGTVMSEKITLKI
jgi:hypothetical protein